MSKSEIESMKAEFLSRGGQVTICPTAKANVKTQATVRFERFKK